MSVEIEPVELGFQRPFTNEVSQILRIRNPNQTPVAFKVKTTAPKQYCVRPNSGRIQPGKEVGVTVLLQAMKEQPPADAKCRDKFLVQSVAVTADKEFTNIGAIWQHVDDAERSSVQEKKIRVVYLPAAATPLRNGINGANDIHSTPETAPPAYSSPRSPSPDDTYTPQANRTSVAQSKVGDEPKTAATTACPSVTPAAAAIPTYDELKVELEKAKEKITSLSQDTELRLRKVAAGETSNQTVNDVAKTIRQQQGVPLQIVAALCLFCFLLAYFFF